MKAPTRLWIWIGGGLLVLVVFTAVLQAINNLIWQLSYLLPAWLVGPFTLLLFGGGALLIARVAWPWLEGWRRQRGGSSGGGTAAAAPPNNRQEAAQQQLQAVDQLLERIRDAVQREALQQERERVAAELERGDLVLVVFGTGSAGKTSLIRAFVRAMPPLDLGAASLARRSATDMLLRSAFTNSTADLTLLSVPAKKREMCVSGLSVYMTPLCAK